jgi:hypothetical protein
MTRSDLLIAASESGGFLRADLVDEISTLYGQVIVKTRGRELLCGYDVQTWPDEGRSEQLARYLIAAIAAYSHQPRAFTIHLELNAGAPHWRIREIAPVIDEHERDE